MAAPGGATVEAPAPALLTKVLVPDAQLLAWAPAATLAVRRQLAAAPVDCLVTTSPPESVHLVALALGRAELQRQQDLFALIQARRTHGFVTGLDVNQQSGVVATAAAQIPLLEAQGVKAMLMVQPSLKALVQACYPSWRLVEEDIPADAYDRHCTLMTLPLAWVSMPVPPISTIAAWPPAVAIPRSTKPPMQPSSIDTKPAGPPRFRCRSRRLRMSGVSSE